MAALAVGVATVYGFGWRGAVLLFAFFISSSLLTVGAKEDTEAAQGGARNARQVIANGGVAALAALAGSWPWFAGALAAANADTWATEIGSHSPTPPRLITTWTRVRAGTDGGITLVGTAGGIAGAGFMAGVSYLLGQRAVLAIAAAGVVAMLVDSLLGASVQGKLPRMDNDAVNLAATLTGAALAGLIA